MGFFNDLGKIVGGLVTAVVPGADRLAATGLFGSDLQAFATGQSPVAAAVTASPALTTALTPPTRFMRVPPTVAVDVVPVPRVHLVALVNEAKRVTFGTYRPPQATAAFAPLQTTPLMHVQSMMPSTPAVPLFDRVSHLLPSPRPPVQVFQMRDQLGRIVNVTG